MCRAAHLVACLYRLCHTRRSLDSSLVGGSSRQHLTRRALQLAPIPGTPPNTLLLDGKEAEARVGSYTGLDGSSSDASFDGDNARIADELVLEACFGTASPEGMAPLAHRHMAR